MPIRKKTAEATTTVEAVKDAVSDIMSAAQADAPKGKVAKPKAKAQSKPAEEPKAEANSEPVKAQYDGFDLKDGTTAEDVASIVDATSKAVDAITRKDADLLAAYLTFGEAQHKLSAMFASTKVYGQALAKAIPATAALDPALRSNCKWLWEALNVPSHEASDILSALKVNRLEDFKSQNPTVIRREYKAAKDSAVKVAAAEANGQSVEDLEKAEKEAAKAEKKRRGEMIAEALEHLKAEMIASKSAKKSAELMHTVMSAVFNSGNGKRAEMEDALFSFLPANDADDEDDAADE